jgi:hypothetical protein
MDFESLGAGGASGMIGAVLAFFGFKQRLDTLESHSKQRIESVEKCVADLAKVVTYKDMHVECARAWHDALDQINKKMDILLSRDK